MVEARRGKVFYGWWIVLVAAIGMSLSYGAVISFTFGVFSSPLRHEFNWSRTATSLAYSISLIVYCAMTPITGRLVDRFGARKVIVPTLLVYGLCLISLHFLTASIWHFYAVYIVMGMVGGGTSVVPYAGVVSHWFDRRRGVALGISAIGVGLTNFLMPSLAHSLITVAGWRGAYMTLGLVTLIAIPVVGFFLIEKPEMMGLKPDGERTLPNEAATHEGEAQGMTAGEALRRSTFWLIFIAFFLIAIGLVGCLIHLVPMLTDRGVSARTAAHATSMLGGAIILGRVVSGYMIDRLFASYVASFFFCATALGILLLWSGVSGGFIFVAAVLLGIGMGAENDIVAYLVSRYFGLRAYAEIYGYVLISFALGGVIGPLLMGVGFDRKGSYSLVLALFVVATLLGAGLMTQLGPYELWKIQAESSAPKQNL